MVFAAIKRNKKLQTISNYFVISLSASDLVFLSCVLPFNIYTFIVDGWFMDASLCKCIGILGYTLTGNISKTGYTLDYTTGAWPPHDKCTLPGHILSHLAFPKCIVLSVTFLLLNIGTIHFTYIGMGVAMVFVEVNNMCFRDKLL